MHEVELAITDRAEKNDLLAGHGQVGQARGRHTPAGPAGIG